jgi:hypothetical protein
MTGGARRRLMETTGEPAFIEKTLAGWHARYQEQFTSQAAHAAFEEFFFKRLRANEGALDAVQIVELARRGHPAADAAVRRLIIEAVEVDRFQELPVSVRAFNSALLLRGPPPTEYPSRAPKVVSHYIRTVAIFRLVGVVQARFPLLPVLYGTERQRSVVGLVGAVFGLTEAQARRVYRDYAKLPQMVATFFNTYPTNGGMPNVR